MAVVVVMVVAIVVIVVVAEIGIPISYILKKNFRLRRQRCKVALIFFSVFPANEESYCEKWKKEKFG